MLSTNKNIGLGLILATLCTTIIGLFLYNKFDVGFIQSFKISDLINYLTLISAIFGGVFAYKILLVTMDQRDTGFMPFLYVLSVQFTSSGIEVNYTNGGQGPAIDVYWESRSAEIKLKRRNPHQEMLRPNHHTGLSRDWSEEQEGINGGSIRSFSFDLICKDQVGNLYEFQYRKNNDFLEFKGAKKNDRKLVST